MAWVRDSAVCQIWQTMGLHPEHGYSWQFLSYGPKTTYHEHRDCYLPHVRDEHARLATLLIYLTDDFEGGATEFPRIPLSLRPPGVPVGGAVVFYNWANQSTCHPLLSHRSAPIISGVKHVLQRWYTYREHPSACGTSNPLNPAPQPRAKLALAGTRVTRFRLACICSAISSHSPRRVSCVA